MLQDFREHACEQAMDATPTLGCTGWAATDSCPRTPGGGDRSSGQPHLGDEVGQVLQRAVEVGLPERRDLEDLAPLGRDRNFDRHAPTSSSPTSQEAEPPRRPAPWGAA